MIAEKPLYFIRHWNGEQTLPLSFWINGVSLYILYWGLYSSASLLLTNYQLVSYSSWTSSAIIWCITIPFSIWQVTGIGKSAERYIELGGSRFWSILAKIFGAILLILNIFNAYLQSSGGLQGIGRKYESIPLAPSNNTQDALIPNKTIGWPIYLYWQLLISTPRYQNLPFHLREATKVSFFKKIVLSSHKNSHADFLWGEFQDMSKKVQFYSSFEEAKADVLAKTILIRGQPVQACPNGGALCNLSDIELCYFAIAHIYDSDGKIDSCTR